MYESKNTKCNHCQFCARVRSNSPTSPTRERRLPPGSNLHDDIRSSEVDSLFRNSNAILNVNFAFLLIRVSSVQGFIR